MGNSVSNSNADEKKGISGVVTQQPMGNEGGGDSNGGNSGDSSTWASWTDPRQFSENFLVTIGVILATLASFLTCVGLAIQKTSLCAPENKDVSSWQQPKWVMGFVCMILGNVIDFLAFGMAPQSLLAPLAALSLVWNLFVSHQVLGEKYDRTDVFACAFIFVGTGMTVVFSSHHEREYTLEALRDLYHKPRMIGYAVITPLLLLLHYCMAKVSEGHKESTYRLMGLIGWCGFAGITGGNSVLFAKSTVELLKDAFHGDDVFWHMDTYLVIIAMVICLLTQISFLNGAMVRYDQLHVLPVYQSYWIISGVVGGLVYFGEFEDLSPMAINMFLLGTMITLFGLYQLTRKENHSLHNAGSSGVFDVLPSRRISEDSFVGFGGFDPESDCGFEIELREGREDSSRLHSDLRPSSRSDVCPSSRPPSRPSSPRRHGRSGSMGSNGQQGRSCSITSLESDDARLRRSPQQRQFQNQKHVLNVDWNNF